MLNVVAEPVLSVEHRKANFDKKVDEDLIGEVQRLRAENAYLKN
jgi:hypothetical protein